MVFSRYTPKERLYLEGIREFAIDAHGDQMYGDFPYSLHLDAVAKLAYQTGYGPYTVAGGYTHDVDEDTKYGIEDIIQAGVIKPIGDGLSYVSCPPGTSRAAKVEKAMMHPAGQLFKFLDSSHNFWMTIHHPKAVSEEERFKKTNEYAWSIGRLSVGLYTPQDMRDYLKSRGYTE